MNCLLNPLYRFLYQLILCLFHTQVHHPKVCTHILHTHTHTRTHTHKHITCSITLQMATQSACHSRVSTHILHTQTHTHTYAHTHTHTQTNTHKHIKPPTQTRSLSHTHTYIHTHTHTQMMCWSYRSLAGLLNGHIGAFLWRYRALLWKYRALLWSYMALFKEFEGAVAFE